MRAPSLPRAGSGPVSLAEELAGAPWPARARATWGLAWPVILAFSLESIVGLIDALLVGRLGANATAAVGLGVQMLSAMNLAMFAVGTGALAIVARHVGAGERAAAEAAVGQSLLAAAGLGLATAAVVVPCAPLLIGLFRIEPGVAAEAVPFIRLLMLGLAPSAVVFTVSASLRAAGDTRTPLLIGAVVGLTNVVLAWGLIFGHFGLPALGVRGAGLATASAFTVGAALGVGLLLRGRLALAVHWRSLRPRPAIVGRVLRVGYPAAIEHAIMQAGFLAYMAFAAHYGTGAVAAYFIGVRVLALAFLPGLGFGAAAGALVGQSLGARRADDATRDGWMAVWLSMAFMTTGGLVLFAVARPVAQLFVDDAAVVDAAVPFIQVLALVHPLMAIDFTLSGALRGAGDTRFPLLVALLGFYVGRLGASYVVTFVLGLPILWLWLTLVLDYIVRASLKSWRFRSGAWQRMRV
ncbi:MAG: MATE family efflux transporter [bacterium]|nr:MATE family efflux transporter [bacterium]